MVFLGADVFLLYNSSRFVFLNMDIDEFLLKLEEEFEDIDAIKLNPESVLRDIPGWSSMHILLLVAMVDRYYNVLLSGENLKSVKTVNDLFNEIIKLRGNQ